MQKKFCSRAGANWQGREMFLQSSYKDDHLRHGTTGFLLDLVLIRKTVCGSSVESVLPDVSMLFTPGIIRRRWLVMAGLVSAPILPHLSLFAWCGEQWNWENTVCFGARSDNLWWVSHVICLTGQCSMGADAKDWPEWNFALRAFRKKFQFWTWFKIKNQPPQKANIIKTIRALG